MKRFLLKLAVWSGCLLVLLVGIYARYAAKYPPQESYYMASLDKHSLLVTQSSPRLIFVGGSATAFGVDSGKVAERCGMNPVNMGLQLRIGLEFMLAEVQPALRSGDVVVVSPEYGAFAKYDQSDPEFLARLIELRPALLRALNGQQLKDFLDEGWVRHLGRVSRAIIGGPKPLAEDITAVYRRSSFNANGDMIAHHGMSNGIAGGRWAWQRLPATASAIARLNEFAGNCRRKGVRVFFSHAPLEQRTFQRGEPAITKLEAELKKSLNIPMLDAPEVMAWPAEYFFDTTEHLNLRGKLRRSDLIAERLLSALRAPPKD